LAIRGLDALYIRLYAIPTEDFADCMVMASWMHQLTPEMTRYDKPFYWNLSDQDGSLGLIPITRPSLCYTAAGRLGVGRITRAKASS